MQDDRALAFILVEERKLLGIFCTQDLARFFLAIRTEHDTAIGQVSRVDIIAGIGEKIVRNDTGQRGGGHFVFENVPGRVIGPAHRKQDALPIERNFRVRNIAGACRVGLGQIAHGRARRGKIQTHQVTAGLENNPIGRVANRVDTALHENDRQGAFDDDLFPGAVATAAEQ